MKFFVQKDYTDVASLEDSDLICFCMEVDKQTIKDAILNGASTLKEIKECTKACTGSECKVKNPTKKCCSPQIIKLIELYKGSENG